MDKSANGHRPSRNSADYISLTWTNFFQCIYININRRLSCDYYILAQIKFFANGFFISTFFGNFVAIIKTFVYIMTVFGIFCRILSCLSTTVCVEQDDISHLKLKVSLFLSVFNVISSITFCHLTLPRTDFSHFSYFTPKYTDCVLYLHFSLILRVFWGYFLYFVHFSCFL